jgi:murein DD-endopeptidase MepM/ murein hydrolase activator NlpD
MRYPVGTGSLEDFSENWYLAQIFGVPALHEGVDINLRSGGNTDMGEPLYAICAGEVVYYHYGSHPGYGFGRHLVLKIEGAWGVRWVHYAHCHADDFLNQVQTVQEGQMIARIGNSGTQLAHLHLAVFKVNPSAIGGIDKVARNVTELYSYWEDPIAFIQTWMQPAGQPVITDETFIPQLGMKVREARETIDGLNARIDQVREIVG